MSFNPILFANEVNKQFIRYQLTAFPLSDPNISEQVKKILSPGMLEKSPLFKGPYLSLSRAFAISDSVDNLIDNKEIHPAIKGILDFPELFAHQQKALRSVKQDRHCLITTGTGSGKTEAFLIPIIDYCLQLRDKGNEPEGIVAIIIYPMNALATDQLERLRKMLMGTGISFGMYVGSTVSEDSKLSGSVQMGENEGKIEYKTYLNRYRDHKNIIISPWEERRTREDITNNPPRILLTNVNQLEFLMTRSKDIGLFLSSKLKYLVVDEAHTYSGAFGAEVSCLLRRLRALCSKSADEVICMTTSATIINQNSPEAPAQEFMSRFFGIDPNKIDIIAEEYDIIKWPQNLHNPPLIGKKSIKLFDDIIETIEAPSNDSLMRDLVLKLTNESLDPSKSWYVALYEQLNQNLLVKTIYEELENSMLLDDAVKKVYDKIQRPLSNLEEAKAELLSYLVLGAVANKDEPLLRPKLHYFIRGLQGMSAVLKEYKNTKINSIQTEPQIYFDANQALIENPNFLPSGIFPVYSCMNCGQHYFEAWLDEVNSEGEGLSGGAPDGDNVYWKVLDEENGTRFLFIDRFVSEDFEVGNLQYMAAIEAKRSPIFVCKYCGAFHRQEDNQCHNPQCRRDNNNLLPVFIIQQKDKLQSCPSCTYQGPRRGGGRLEPIRKLRAVTVADIHILAQDLINTQMLEQQKLIIFSDNRQDAAFQSAWINQRARRYRFRHLLYSLLKDKSTPTSIGDLSHKVFEIFKADRQLTRYMAPEVYSTESDDVYSRRIEENLKKFIRIMILLELTQAMKWRRNLEAWGMLRVVYSGVSDDTNEKELEHIAKQYGLNLEEIRNFLENILDIYRRSNALFDPLTPIFERFWHEGNDEIQHGIVPSSLVKLHPFGLAFEKDENNERYAKAFYSQKGKTLLKDLGNKSGIGKDQMKDFLEDIWNFLIKVNIFIPINLKSSKNRLLPGAAGLYHIDDQKLGLIIQEELYRCTICQRIHTRSTPKHCCSAYNCKGNLIREIPSEDDYDVQVLKRDFTMMIAREHTAQVPAKLRADYEKEFKKTPEPNKMKVNCLVSSPTLELGVDIGNLDVILLRNVPPLPSNYWQRAGRAGRRHHMALIYTYCRKSIHDDYFFVDPLRMLAEKIMAPKFNLKNHVMIEKHCHASILSKIESIKNLNAQNIDEETLLLEYKTTLPSFLKGIVFSGNIYRKKPFDLGPFINIFEKFQPDFEEYIFNVFQQYWPAEALSEIRGKVLKEYIDSFTRQLSEIYKVIHREFMWVLETKKKLQKIEEEQLLDDMQRKLLTRCKSYIYRVKEDNLSNYMLSILSDRGFLPNYFGLGGNIIAYVNKGYSATWNKIDFELNRTALIALREYSPGNLIYANGGKYRTAFFHFPVREDTDEPIDAILPDTYLFSTETFRIIEKGKPTSGYNQGDMIEIEGIPISNVDLSFLSHVSDSDDYRFRMACRSAGYLQSYHRGGEIYSINDLELHHIHGQKIRFVNIGPIAKEKDFEFGYPICIVCGATRSPFASDRELEHFIEHHSKKTCGKEPGNYALTTDADVDMLLFKSFKEKTEAINYAEAIRMGANIILEMNRDDLEILLLPETEEEYNIVIYDPMPGGSGLLGQIIERWKEVCNAALILLDCSNQCQLSCYVCMRTYRNIMNHDLFDRNLAMDLIKNYTTNIIFRHDIPARTGQAIQTGTSTNWTEQGFRNIFNQHSFPAFDAQKEIKLMGQIPSTTPDFYYEDSSTNKKLAIYIDGLSRSIHGNRRRQKIDTFITQALENFYKIKVIRIPATARNDPRILDFYLQEIANHLK